MTTIYIPQRIETAEQAEALPNGTCAKIEETAGTGAWYAPPRVNTGRGRWFGDDLYRCSDMVGWMALVPIEAEEETRGITTAPRPDSAPWPRDSQLFGDSEGSYYYRDEDGVAHDITEEASAWMVAQPTYARYVTPWEEA